MCTDEDTINELRWRAPLNLAMLYLIVILILTLSALQDELLASCATQAGFVCNKEDINTDKGMFSYSGVYQEVDARVVTKNGKVNTHSNCQQPCRVSDCFCN